MGKISELINQMIQKVLESAEWTSANPTHVNTLIQVNEIDNPDFEQEIKQLISNKVIKEGKESELKEGTSMGTNKIDFDKITGKDVGGMLGKVGIEPSKVTSLLSLTSGKGGLGMLGKFGALAGIASPFAIAMMVKPVTESIIKELQRPGGFLDKRVKIDARNETLAELDRQTRQNTRIGDRQVIIQQFSGFRNYDGFASSNTSEMIRTNADRVLNVGLFDRAQGLQ